MNLVARFVAVAFLATVAIFAANDAFATTKFWLLPSPAADWSTAPLWSGPGFTMPTASDTAVIANGGTATVTLLGETCGTLSLGSGAGSGTVYMTAGGLATINSEYIGDSGPGSFVQSGGTHTVSNALYAGNSVGSSGSYSLSGSGQLSTLGNEYIGFAGSGSFIQSGGTNSACFLLIGNEAGSSGTYSLSGSGQLSATGEYMGSFGTGSFIQSGGTHAVSDVFLGNFTGGSGTYSLSGGGLLSTYDVYVGYFGSGSFTQSAGTHSMYDVLSVGDQHGSSGTYTLSGSGQLSAPAEYVGNSGGGSFTQSGGTNSASFLYIGNQAGSGGMYSLSGSGQLSAQVEYIGNSGSGSFTQSGGANAASGVVLGYNAGTSGTYTLSGSGLLSSFIPEEIGYSGSGSFTQSGGTNSTGGIQLTGFGGVGTYNLAGGLLILTTSAGPTQGAGSATFNFSGGTIQTGASITSSVPIVFNGSGGVGTFDTEGNLLVLAGPLSGPGGLNKAGVGTLDLMTSESYTGPTSVSGGYLYLLADNASSSFTVNSGGFLVIYGVTLNLNTRFVHALAGGNAEYANATINGGFLRGPGNHFFAAGYTNILNATTINNGAAIQQSGTASFIDVANAGQVVNYPDAALTWQGGYNATSGVVTVSDFSTVSVSEWYNDGVITINNGGLLNNSVTDLVSGGGGRIYVNSGGTLRADSQMEGVALDLQDSLLVNNGRVTGTVNVYYGATVSGSGSFGPINVYQAGAVVAATTAVPAPTSLTVTSGSITGAGNLRVSATVADATIATPNLIDKLTLSGDLSGPGPITKTGAGTLILSGTNTYAGGTNVVSGTLEITSSDGILDGSNLTVGADATLFLGAVVPAAAAAGDAQAVPEPSSFALLAAGILLFAGHRCRGQKPKVKAAALSAAITLLATTAILGAADASAATRSWQSVSPAADWSNSAFWTGGAVPTAGDAAYIVNGGTANITRLDNTCGTLSLGSGAGSGTVLMAAGSLATVSNDYVGNSGLGSFVQSGGTHTVSSALFLGYVAGGNGSYTLSGSGLLSVQSEAIAQSGVGSFTQSGGTHAVSNVLFVGGDASGSYSMMGGSLSVLTEYVGYSTGATGNFVQSGGTHAVSGGLSIGYGASISGTYSLSSSGQLSTPFEWIGRYGSGNFTQTGGGHAVSNTLVVADMAGSSGTYNLAGGSLAAGLEWVGNSGSGSFTQTGGSNAVGNLVIAQNPGSVGTYNLNGGLLNLSALLPGAGTAAFNFSGGTFQAASTFATSAPITLTTSASIGTFDTNGNTLTLNGPLSGPGGLVKIGAGTLIMTASNTFLGDVTVSAGTLQIPSGLMGSNGNEYVATTGTASLVQSGGINAINFLSIGDQAGSKGTYNLSGSGLLYANYLLIGNSGSGSFTQSGGTNTPSTCSSAPPPAAAERIT